MDLSKVKHVIVHCSATPYDRDIGADEIRDWHVNDNGWSDIGYHYVIRLDGTIESGRPLNKSGAHCKGLNSQSIGICLIGGIENTKTYKPVDWYTGEQMTSLAKLVKALRTILPDDFVVSGHYEHDSSKTCPNFSPRDILAYHSGE